MFISTARYKPISLPRNERGDSRLEINEISNRTEVVFKKRHIAPQTVIKPNYTCCITVRAHIFKMIIAVVA